jgi:coenzyme PQQ synthesis protein D (PqqD)
MHASIHNPVVRSANLGFFPLDDSMIAIDRQSGYCYALNKTSARIWELIEAPVSEESICQTLCEEFAVEPAACLVDVREILLTMRSAGLLSECQAE